MGVFEKICDIFSPFSMSKRKSMLDAVNEIAVDVASIRRLNEIRSQKVLEYKRQIEELEARRRREQNLFMSIVDHLDDMVWAKDKTGKYIMANRAFREKFCYGMEWEELRGKTDIEIATIFKERVGNENHTFGEVCANSDEVVLRTNKAREFLEYGNINGELVKLIVNKSPVYDEDGVLFATAGSGRNVTWLHDKLEKALNFCSSCKGTESYSTLEQLFKEIEFKEGDHERDKKQ